MSSVSSVEPTAQQNFNPSWMRPNRVASGGSARLSATGGGGGVGFDDGGEDPAAAAAAILSTPIVSEFAYTRERLLELAPTGSIMPDALRDQLFFNENSLPLVSNTPLSDLEQRLQHNINSSKAMSLLSHADRASIAAGAAYGSGYGNGAVGGGGALQNGQSPNRWAPKPSWSKTTPDRTLGSTPRGGGSVGRPGGAGSFFAGRGGGRIGGENGFGGSNGSSSTPGNEDGGSSPYQPKFSALRRGGGAGGVGRGGSTSGVAFNSRADALYNPNDPTDRPKTVASAVTRSDSDDDDEEGGWSKVGATSRHTSTTSERPAWARSESWIQRTQQQQAASAAAASGSPAQSSQPPSHWNASAGDSAVWKDRNQMVASVKKTEPPSSQPPAAAAPTHAVKEEPDTEPTSVNSAPPPQPQPQSIQMPSYAPNSSTWSNNVMGGGIFYQPPPAPPAPPVKEEPIEFYYMDPTETRRGPFPKDQMTVWFKAGYFTDETLRVQRGEKGEYKTIGELKKLHGAMTPFDYAEDVEKPRFPPQPPVSTMPGIPNAIFAANQPTFPGMGMWGQSADVYSMMQTTFEQQMIAERQRLLDEHNRRIAEEAKKMAEFQEAMYRQLTMQQEMSQQQLREKEIALQRHREELERRDAELKQEALARQQQMENEARELEERKAAIEAEDRRKRLIEEAKRQEEAQRASVAKEAAERVRRAEEAAEKERIRLEQEARQAEEVIRQIKLKKEAEEKQKRIAEERERQAREAAEVARIAEQAELEAVWTKKPEKTAPKQISPSGSDDSEGWTPIGEKREVKHTKAAPWAAKAVEQVPPTEKTLLEIQKEEERQLRAEREQLARQKAKELAAMPVSEKDKSWGAKTGWAATPVETVSSRSYVSPFLDGPSLEAANKMQLQKKNSLPKITVPAAKPAAPTTPAAKKASAASTTPTSAQKKKTKQESEAEAMEQWFVKRFRQFSSAIDCKTLYECIMELENPNEVEDIVMSYLDESKTVKEFVREFIKRRIAMRAAGGRPDVDDLTSARTASAAPSDSNSGSNSNSGNGQGKKKKKNTKQVLDGNILGFRGAAASDRLNKGEIDAVPTAPVNPSRR